jgi:phage shock protein E
MNLLLGLRPPRTCAILPCLVALVLACSAGASAAETYWIDVRSTEEYAEGHIPGAINIPHTEIVERIGEVTTDRDAPIYLYCRSGRRSDLARNALQQAGYTGVTDLGGLQEARATAERLKACRGNPAADC